MIESIAVIGGKGQMGQLFLDLCRESGVRGLPFDKPLNGSAAELIPSFDLVLIAVPIDAMAPVLAEIGPYLREEQILADLCSVKVAPMRQMMEAHSGPVVGTHPLFGPTGPDTGEVRVAVAEARGRDAFDAVHELCTRMGLSPFETTDEEHDRVMAFVQGLNFVTTIAYFSCTASQEEIGKFMTPSFQRRLDAAVKMITKDSDMFETIFETNPFSQDSVRRFRDHLQVAAGGDINLLTELARRWWSEDYTYFRGDNA
jgi:prephenate dehydrogenase